MNLHLLRHNLVEAYATERERHGSENYIAVYLDGLNIKNIDTQCPGQTCNIIKLGP